MAYLTEKQLMAEADSYNVAGSKNIMRFASNAQLTIFLSHSHQDRKIVEGIIKLMGSQSITVYVDWNDSSMPRITNRITAAKIKDKIKEMRIFLILGTSNAMASVWVPWETGVADQCKKGDEMYVVPVADSSGKYYGNEYLQLYNRIELDYGKYLKIVPPNKTLNEGISFDEHFRNKLF